MLQSRRKSSVLWLSLAMSLPLLAGACSIIPRSSPTAESMTESAAQPVPPFALVEINEPLVDSLVHWPEPSLFGRFGDYRGPADQRIGVGDSLLVTVWEAAGGGLFSAPVNDARTPGSHSALIPEQVVARDGAITVPYAGRIQVIGRTAPEVEHIIVERLAGKAIEPQALVTIAKNVSNTVTVTGEVTSGARVPLSPRGDRILDVIASAGGIHAPVHESFIELSRGGHSVRVPMQALLNTPRENIFARPGDVLTVVQDKLTFTAIGATGRNAVIPFDEVVITLEEAVAKAGGPLDDRADPEGVFVLRYEPAGLARSYPNVSPDLLRNNLVPIAYHLNLRDPQSLFLQRRFAMREKDILFISNSPINDLQKVLMVVNLVTQPLFSAAYAVTTAATVIK
jgi:polysaccharide export outer membrane protein